MCLDNQSLIRVRKFKYTLLNALIEYLITSNSFCQQNKTEKWTRKIVE